MPFHISHTVNLFTNFPFASKCPWMNRAFYICHKITPTFVFAESTANLHLYNLALRPLNIFFDVCYVVGQLRLGATSRRSLTLQEQVSGLCYAQMYHMRNGALTLRTANPECLSHLKSDRNRSIKG